MGVHLTSGKWAFEVEIKAAGTGFVGWCSPDYWHRVERFVDGSYTPGMDECGWSYDGHQGIAQFDVTGARHGIPRRYVPCCRSCRGVARVVCLRASMLSAVPQVWKFVASGRCDRVLH